MVTEVAQRRRAESAVLRRIWRLHFWVGVFAAPVLLTLACTGLIILYTQPLDMLLNRSLLAVPQAGTAVSLDEQVAAARREVPPEMVLDAVVPPSQAGRSTRVDFLPAETPEVGERNLTQVFVDPHTGGYLGQRSELDGLIGWANQLHRLFGNDGPTVSLPSVGHLIAPADNPEPFLKVGIGNLILEMTAVWVLVLLATGIFLWWPRAIEGGKPRLAIRWRKGGRLRWRDLHATTGILVSAILVGYIVSGLTWSRYWGENWRVIAETLTSGTVVDAPSTPATVGDLDRLGRRVAWADKNDPIYASAPGAGVPRPLGFAEIDQIARSEGMLAGYAIAPPSDSPADGVFGSYTVSNYWPQRLSEQRTLYLDQFTGATLADATAAQDGALSRATSWSVDMHMGTQYGLLSRILSTIACLALLTSITSAAVMWWKRRPTGGAGLPGRTGEATRAATPRGALVAIGAVAAVLAVIYPSFGLTLLVVLAAEAVLGIRRRASDRAPDQVSAQDSATASAD